MKRVRNSKPTRARNLSSEPVLFSVNRLSAGIAMLFAVGAVPVSMAKTETAEQKMEEVVVTGLNIQNVLDHKLPFVLNSSLQYDQLNASGTGCYISLPVTNNW